MKRVIGIAVCAIFLLAVLSVGYRWYNANNQTPSAQVETRSTVSTPPRGPNAPEIVSDTWLNSTLRSSADLRGKVVVVEFWTFG
jgi:hypothetical protein